MTRILYLSPYFWPEEIGSAPYCTDLARWFSESGFKVEVVSFRPHYPNLQAFEGCSDATKGNAGLSEISIIRVPVNGRGRGGFRERILNDFTFLRKIVSVFLTGKLIRPDVIVAYVPTIFTLYGAVLVRLFTGAKILAVVHDLESGLAGALGIAKGGLVLTAMRRVERIGLNFASAVVTLTEGMKTELQSLGCRAPVFVLPIWAAESDFIFSPPPDHAGETIVTYSGNFGKKQNLEQLVPLIQHIHSQELPFRFILRGEGSEKARIQEALADKGVTNTAFLPLVPSEDLISSMKSAHIHLVPQASNVSNYAMPSKLISIMSAGRPFIAIAERGSAVEELTTKSAAGVFVPAGHIDELQKALEDLSRDRERQVSLGRNGQRFVASHMDRTSTLNAYAGIVEEIAAGRAPRLAAR